MTPRAKPEAAVQGAIRARLEELGWLVIKVHGSRFQAGLPDLFCARGGVQLWLEVKRPKGGRLTQAQRVWFPRLARAGVAIYLVKSLDELEDVLAGRAERWQPA